MSSTYKNIYVAEDQPAQRELIRAGLEGNEAYRTSFFVDGLEAYRKIQEDLPDLVILDIILPSLSGLAVTRLLKFHDTFSKIPVIVMTSITDPDIQERALQAGADAFLPKHFKLRDLQQKVAQLLA